MKHFYNKWITFLAERSTMHLSFQVERQSEVLFYFKNQSYFITLEMGVLLLTLLYELNGMGLVDFH